MSAKVGGYSSISKVKIGRFGALLVSLLVVAPGDARAICDVIPQITDRYRAALGSTTRSFAAPGRSVELLVRQELCDQATRSASPGFPLAASQYVVSIVFTPTVGAAAHNLYVLRDSCAGISANTCTDLGQPLPNGGTVTCLEPTDPPLHIRDVDLGECRLSRNKCLLSGPLFEHSRPAFFPPERRLFFQHFLFFQQL